MKLQDICKEIYLINLDRRCDRLQKCKDQAEKFGFSFERVSAFDAQEIFNFTNLRPGENALLQSHVIAINIAKERNLDKVIILEDDFECVPDFNERLVELGEVPKDWDIIYYGANHGALGAQNGCPAQQISEKILKLNNSFCTHSLLIRQNMYNYILEGIAQYDKPLDIIYTDLQKKFNIYGFVKSLMKQYDSHSDILGYDPRYNEQGIFD